MVDTGWIEKSAAKEKAKAPKHLAQGNTLGNIHTRMSPCKGKSMILHCGNAFCTYRAHLFHHVIPRALPWARCFWAFSPCSPV